MKKHKNKHILNIEQEREIKLAEMGAELRAARQEKCISLEQIAAKTMIRVNQLQAIEEGKIEKLPEAVYIQGFLRRFADALGLDGAAFASEFPIGASKLPSQLAEQFVPPPQLRPYHLYLVYLFLMILSVKGLSVAISNAGMQARDGKSNPQASALPVATKNQAPGGKKEQARTVRAPIKVVRVDLTFKEKSWIQIFADGKLEFEGELDQGTQRTWEANQQLVVVAGNAGGVLLAVNDGQAKQMGQPGQVQEVTFKVNPKS